MLYIILYLEVCQLGSFLHWPCDRCSSYGPVQMRFLLVFPTGDLHRSHSEFLQWKLTGGLPVGKKKKKSKLFLLCVLKDHSPRFYWIFIPVVLPNSLVNFVSLWSVVNQIFFWYNISFNAHVQNWKQNHLIRKKEKKVKNKTNQIGTNSILERKWRKAIEIKSVKVTHT